MCGENGFYTLFMDSCIQYTITMGLWDFGMAYLRSQLQITKGGCWRKLNLSRLLHPFPKFKERIPLSCGGSEKQSLVVWKTLFTCWDSFLDHLSSVLFSSKLTVSKRKKSVRNTIRVWNILYLDQEGHYVDLVLGPNVLQMHQRVKSIHFITFNYFYV